MLTAEFQSADCGCLNSYGCLIPRFFCGPFLTGISQEDTFEKGWGEKERESMRMRMLKTEGENLDRPCSSAIENLNSSYLHQQ